jgi:DNA-binding XRE family transcriptional regulator
MLSRPVFFARTALKPLDDPRHMTAGPGMTTPETNNLRLIREARQLSQGQLAKLAGTSQSQIDRMEKDGIPGAESRELTKRWAIRLAPYLETTAEELMGFSVHHPSKLPTGRAGFRAP